MAKSKPAARLSLASLDKRVKALEDATVTPPLKSEPAWLQVLVFASLALSSVALLPTLKGCKVPVPTPIVDDEKGDAVPKMLQGTIVFVHNRDPLSAADADLLVASEKHKASTAKYDWASIDAVKDASEQATKIKAEALKAGFKPPFVMHKSLSGGVKFGPMPATFDELVTKFGS